MTLVRGRASELLEDYRRHARHARHARVVMERVFYGLGDDA